MRLHLLAGILLLFLPLCAGPVPAPDGQAPAGQRPRVIVSSDIGGTDPDDTQSMVHFLLYADMFDVEALVSSPYGPGRREHILEVIGHYERDYASLRTHSTDYPAPDALRAITRQGAIDSAGAGGFGTATAGSDWIVQCARRPDPRPLYVLVWGGIDDPAQAPTTLPRSLPKLRVISSAGRTRCGASTPTTTSNEQHHPGLRIVEANTTYRGWFTGGNQAASGATPRSSRRTSPDMARSRFLRDPASGHDQDGRQSVSRLPAARYTGGSIAARMGRKIRASLGWEKDHLRSPDDRVGPGRGVRRRRIRAADPRRHDRAELGANDR
jgi:hypothetical protein